MPGRPARSPLRVGSRGSKLALVQTELVLDRLRALQPEYEFDVQTITTSGDRSASAPIGEGVFVKEIERALAAGEIDIAVHSLKDLPTEEPGEVVVAAIPEREDPRESLVGGTLAGLPAGARVGTGSPRRMAQVKRLRGDLEVVSIRGNVPTRIEKAKNGEVDAVVLALAGLRRLSIEPDEIFEADRMLPAPGQGALAVEIREDDEEMAALLAQIDHAETRAAVTAERLVLSQLGGGCLLPVAALGEIRAGRLSLRAAVVSPDGTREARAESEGDLERPLDVATAVASRLKELDALSLLEPGKR